MDRLQALNLAAYIFLAVVIILTTLTVWGIVRSERHKGGDGEGE